MSIKQSYISLKCYNSYSHYVYEIMPCIYQLYYNYQSTDQLYYNYQNTELSEHRLVILQLSEYRIIRAQISYITIIRVHISYITIIRPQISYITIIRVHICYITISRAQISYRVYYNTFVSNHFHSVQILLFSAARSRDFDGTPGTELLVSMYTTKTPIDMCCFNV